MKLSKILQQALKIPQRITYDLLHNLHTNSQHSLSKIYATFLIMIYNYP